MEDLIAEVEAEGLTMIIIFNCDSASPALAWDTIPEPLYRDEWDAAIKAGFETGLINHDLLVGAGVSAQTAVDISMSIKTQDQETPAIYRGWMLTSKQYTELYEALKTKNVILINTPDEYKHCHYLPEWYPDIKEHTPKSMWFPLLPESDVWETFRNSLVSFFGDTALILKDYVKSAKHDWHNSCFIPSSADVEKIKSTVLNFFEWQEPINEGLVFREFIELESIGTHPKSGMPLTKEYRLFIKNGKTISHYTYWDPELYSTEKAWIDILDPEYPKWLQPVIDKVKSRFFTMDLAVTTEGEWIIIELGDGQVSGLPEHAKANQFYQSLKRAK